MTKFILFYLLIDQWCWLEKWTNVGKVKNDEERLQYVLSVKKREREREKKQNKLKVGWKN